MELFQDYSLNINFTGMCHMTVPTNEVSSSVYTIEQNSLLTGVEYFRIGNSEDTILLEIFDQSDRFINVIFKDLYMNSHAQYEFYKIKLTAGNKVKLTYKNNGSESAKINFNLVLHTDRQ